MRTRRDFRFRPSCPRAAALEDRVVPTGGGTQASPVLLQGLHAPARVFGPHRQPAASSLVQLAFQSFQQDYTAVRATYLASVQNRTATAADTATFKTYTAQRVNLLAQQVLNSLMVYAQSTTRGHRVTSPLTIVVERIDGVPNPNVGLQQQSLYANLTGTIPSADASPTTIALDTIAQDNAIQASGVAALNGVTIIRNGNFGNARSSKH
jgi:hypothetical protein